MDIMIQPSADHFLNSEDSAMMQFAIKRLCAMWLDARIDALTNRPDLLPRYSSWVLPISNAGRSLWIAVDLMHLPARRHALHFEQPSISSVLRRLRCWSHARKDQQSVEAFVRLVQSVSALVVAGLSIIPIVRR